MRRDVLAACPSVYRSGVAMESTGLARSVSNDETIAQAVERLAQALLCRSARLATAESCTGGGLAAAMTDRAGSSAWFECGYVTYSNAAKQRDLGVSAEGLAAHGAVSVETAAAMARGAAIRAGVPIAVAVTGIAGPGGATPGKPVGTVCFGFCVDGRVDAVREWFAGDREAVRRASVLFALEGLLARLTSRRDGSDRRETPATRPEHGAGAS